MEVVASPSIPFGAGVKRQFPGASPIVTGLGSQYIGGHETSMMDPDCTMQQQQPPFKRRRCIRSDEASMDAENNNHQHAFLPFHTTTPQQQTTPFNTNQNQNRSFTSNNKRRYSVSSSSSSSNEVATTPTTIKARNASMEQKKLECVQTVAASQQAEITQLKADKAELDTTVTALQADHAKVTHENRTLKRAVLIQQDRQQHADTAVRAAHRDRTEAEEKIQKLEHLVLSLRYHLQAQHNNTPRNDFLNTTDTAGGGQGGGDGNGFVF